MKSKIFLFISSLTFITCIGLSCTSIASVKGSSTLIKSNYDIKNFDALKVSHAISIKIIQAEAYKVVVEHNDNLKQYLVVEKLGSSLKIGLKNGKSYKNVKVSAVIYTPNIAEIEMSGASQVYCDLLKVEKLKVNSSGASSFKAEVYCENLIINSSGASSFDVMGETENMTCEISGASNIKGKSLLVKNDLVLRASGASYVSIMSGGEIRTKLSGASVLHHYGNGRIVEQSVTGASNIKAKEL